MSLSALLVEDRPEIAKLWSACLSTMNFKITLACNLSEAFVTLQKIPPPDLVLLDLNLNETETAEFTVTQIPLMKQFNPELVVIVISGVLTPELIAESTKQGAHAVRDKFEMTRQVDFWNAIVESLDNAPKKAKNLFEHPLNLLETLSQKLHHT